MSNVVYIKSYKKEEFSSNENDGFGVAGAALNRDKVTSGETTKTNPVLTRVAAQRDGIPMVHLEKLHEIEASWLKLQRLYADLELEHQALREMVEKFW